MTLSYCWGKLNILKLTVENLSQLLKSIPFTELPKTFQDAISITRALGIQYLWIDSLCILQDSEDDWWRESAMMGDVYSNSFCNIAATKAKDGSVGCFGNIDVFEAIPLIIKPAAGSPALQSRLTDGDEYPEYHFLSDDLVNQAITYSPLGCRAWFFQERLLSPRILHFSAHQMVFECPKVVACERYLAGVPVMPGKEHLKQSASITSETLAQLSSDQWPELHLIWEEIVKTYSGMSLTYVKDKLIAISGIAQRMSGSFKCNYLAGLWEERLLEQLLWEVEGPKPSCRKPYQAPSWSWASINGRIKNVVTCFDISAYHAPCFEMFLVTVLDARVTTTDATQFGQVTAGYLRIRGRLIPATRSNYGFSAQENAPPIWDNDLFRH